MAVGTVASRATGFVRTSLIAAAIGSAAVGDAYLTAYTLPFTVYELLLGGVLTSVVVPMLVRAGRPDDTGPSDVLASQLLSLVAVLLGVATVGLVLAAPVLTMLFAPDFDPASRELATALTRLLLVGLVFYGLSALLGGVLNLRGRFAAPMWAPVVNNLLVIGTGVVFLLLPGPATLTPASMTTAQLLVLGIGTTLGTVAQVVTLLVVARRAGFAWRFRLDLPRARLAEVSRLGAWMLVYVAASQAGVVVIARLANSVTDEGVRISYADYIYAQLLWQLPHAVVAVSVITALLPRMSRAAAGGRLSDVAADLSLGTRLTATVLVPATAAFVLLGPAIATLVFAHGQVSVADGRAIGTVLAVSALGLLPFSVSLLQLRAFYALQDTRTPALINLAVAAVKIGIDVTLFLLLPAEVLVLGLAAGNAVSFVVAVVLSGVLLRRRIGVLGTGAAVGAVVRLTVAALVAAVPAGIVAAALPALLGPGPLASLATLALAGALAGPVFLLLAVRLGVEEVRSLLAPLHRRVRH